MSKAKGKSAKLPGKLSGKQKQSNSFRGKQQLQLLNNIDGVFAPGVLTALMGTTGAGKTTLMDVLAGRKTGDQSSHYRSHCQWPWNHQSQQQNGNRNECCSF